MEQQILLRDLWIKTRRTGTSLKQALTRWRPGESSEWLVIPFTWLSPTLSLDCLLLNGWGENIESYLERVIIAAWVRAGPQSQNNNVGWNVHWKQTWTLRGTRRLFLLQIGALLPPGWLMEPRSVFHIFSVDKHRSLTESSPCWRMLRFDCAYVRVHVLHVCDKW